MEPNRVAEVFVSGESSQAFGSGYLIAPGVVLTVNHVIAPALGNDKGRVEVRFIGDWKQGRRDWQTARIYWHNEARDLALLKLVDQAAGYQAGPDKFCQVARRSRTPLDCSLIGFPRVLNREEENDTEEVKAEFLPHTAMKEGRLHLLVKSRTPDRQEDWTGISGAAVFSNDAVLMGVVIETHLSFREVLIAQPLDELFVREAWLAAGYMLPAPPLREHASKREEESVPNELPEDISNFTGREVQLSKLTTALASPSATESSRARVVALSGMGGIGKSALAIHAAHSLKHLFEDGQLYANLEGARETQANPADVLGGFIKSLKKSACIPESLDERSRLFRSLLVDRKILIVLDNAYDETQIRPLIPAGASIAVLITSRRRLSALESATILQLDVMPEAEAGSLLRNLISDSRRTLELEQQTDMARELILHCDGLPLALRIVAGKLNEKSHWSLREYVLQLRSEQDRLAKLNLGDLQVRSALGISYRDLTAVDAQLFRFLGCVSGSGLFVAEAAAIWRKPFGAAQDVLEVLGDVQLLEPLQATDEWLGAHQYRFHDLVRLFAVEELGEHVPTGEQIEARQRGKLGRELNEMWFGAYLKSVEGSEKSWLAAIKQYEDLMTRQRQLGVSDSRSEGAIVRSIAASHLRIGVAAAKDSKWPKATRRVERAVKLFGKDAPREFGESVGEVEHGLYHIRRGEMSEALACWEKALAALDPSFQAREDLELLRRFYSVRETQWQELHVKAGSLAKQRRWTDALAVLDEAKLILIEQMAITEDGIFLQSDRKVHSRELLFNHGLRAIAFAALGVVSAAESELGGLAALALNIAEPGAFQMEASAKADCANELRRAGLNAWNRHRLDDAQSAMEAAIRIYLEIGMEEAGMEVQQAVNAVKLELGDSAT